MPPALRLFLDVTLTIRHGLVTPIGLVRVEHYIADILARDPSVDLHFIVYDREYGAYRPLTGAEQNEMQQILYHRYETEPDASNTPADMQPHVATPPDGRLKRLRLRMRRVPLLRVGIRLARRLTAAPPMPALQVIGADDVLDGAKPGPGDVLICTANMWDYMDYAYLDRLCRRDDVRLVSVIHDVIAMELPFTTPWPPHIYHRHWVEIGHISYHLLAVSQHSVRTYQHFIAEPNDLTTSISHAHPPNFLKARAAAIGEVPIAGLEGRPFVVYCSTIEIRKNHQLLLNVWDQLRQDISADRLPVLVFAGKWGWGTETIRLLTERNWRLRDHLRVLDRVSDAELIWLYRNARFTVFPSYSEGYGLGAAESLSFGTPVVVSDCPALVEASEGLMPAHAPHDFVAWYNQIRSLATDDAALEELRAAAERYHGPGFGEFACALREVARRAAVH